MKNKKITIVKIGGNVIENEKNLSSFLQQFAAIEGPKILVQGGGKAATALGEKMGVPAKLIDGRRITDAATLKIITMVYAGAVNKNIVAQLQALGINAIGMSGADANLVQAVKRPVKTIDYGFVGDVTQVSHESLEKLISAGFVPVCCAISHDSKGQLLNTNADTIAAEVSIAASKIGTTELYYCFEKPGVLSDVNDDTSIIPIINSKNYPELLQKGVIFEGMLPKLTNCFHALKHGVHQVHIGDQHMFHQNQKPTLITE
jgi:acetylglutamate kinase